MQDEDGSVVAVLNVSPEKTVRYALERRLTMVGKPFVADAERATVTRLASDIDRVVLRFGSMDDVAIPAGLACSGLFTSAELDKISYYIGRETVIADPRILGMAPWREELFVSMQRNTAPTGNSFCVPSKQLIEIGTEVRI
ncbi:MAG: hypothetical protein EOO77_00580 [Oxalobacteraceae bacterium]|nr:MAG: hypothetical protein EOO77_00580 [Oxalobacteraceae bacterium]